MKLTMKQLFNLRDSYVTKCWEYIGNKEMRNYYEEKYFVIRRIIAELVMKEGLPY